MCRGCTPHKIPIPVYPNDWSRNPEGPRERPLSDSRRDRGFQTTQAGNRSDSLWTPGNSFWKNPYGNPGRNGRAAKRGSGQTKIPPGYREKRTPGVQRNDPMAERSEEHTSELQSRENLVCRLLLEKKKKKI